jgi:hypothetical protein
VTTRINPPEIVEVHFGITVADAAAPTSTELIAFTDITSDCRGVPNIPDTGNTAPTDDLSSKFNKRQAASHGGDNFTLELYRDTGADAAYDLLVALTAGFFAVAWDGLATAGVWAIADNVWLYEGTIISRGMGQPGRDEVEFFTCEFAITEPPNEKFALVA